MRKLLIIILLLAPFQVFAQVEDNPNTYFRAEVLEILEERENELGSGEKVVQQNLLLLSLEGEYVDKEFEFIGIDDFGVIGQTLYETGDKVLVVASLDYEGNTAFYVTDYVRTGSMWWLFIIFVLSILVVGRWKGLRSLLSLALSFLVIIKYLIPKILAGSNPIVITLISSFIILLVVIYLTEGLNTLSHLSFVSILLSLVVTVFISWFFVTAAKLTGVASEEVAHLINIGEGVVNFRGLLLAGIIIGTLGVLDDVIISQVATVREISGANKKLKFKQVYKRAHAVGTSHIASMTNTLFLAYVGVSLPLLILFGSGESAFGTFGQVVNNEAIATEIIRTLAGSIGLILSVPLATVISVWYYTKNV